MSHHYQNAKYMTIAEVIARRLRAGEFQNEEQFYSRDELARAYHMSPGTARAVLRVLEDRGVIECRKGKRPVPADAGIIEENSAPPICRPVFVRDSCTAETPEYDYLLYCARNILLRRKTGLLEYDPDYQRGDADSAAAPGCAPAQEEEKAGHPAFPEFSPGDVAIVFPSAAGETPDRTAFRPSGGRIDLLIDQAGNNAMSVFTRKACLDCALRLIRQNTAAIIHIVSKHSAFPWFRHISTPGVLDGYLPECRLFTAVFDDELEMFPNFLAESVPAATGPEPAAVLIDDPYLSDYLSGEIRVGAYHPPLRCSFSGTAFNERSMVFPYLDLKLDALAASLIRTAFSKAENPAANLACDFHPIQFRNPGSE